MNFFLSDTALLELKNVLEQARTVPSGDLPELIGKLAEANAVALWPAIASTHATGGRIAGRGAGCGAAEPFRKLFIPASFSFERRMGRKRLYSANGIDAYISKNQNGGR